jgi:glycosyltransferase involved in cell wall biosynthesis
MSFSQSSTDDQTGVTNVSRQEPHRRFVMISTCPEPWGGSEELWSGAACALLEKGHRVSAFKTIIDRDHPVVQRLETLSCKVRNLRSLSHFQPVATRVHLLSLAIRFLLRRPDLVVISQGDNHDGLHFGYLCKKLRIPYTLISQKANDFFWPPDASRAYRRDVFGGAARCYFVSNHNRRLTEDQNGATLTNAEIVRNPHLAPAEPLAWPAGDDDCLRLACVARLYLLDKGQDILLRVLAQEKWKNRNLYVSFFGRGFNGEALRDLARRLDIRKVSFEGQTADVPGIWKNHHALILASRAEGLPLSLVEAMMCGRPAIVTNVGGNAEVLTHGVTGFLAAPFENSIDEALEEAWTNRHELQEMGRVASKKIRELVPPNPSEDFADKLLKIASAVAQPKGAGTVTRQIEDSVRAAANR